MVEIVQAPNTTTSKGIKLFLAGGISNCPQWQNEISEKLVNEPRFNEYDDINIIVFNPRCKEIPEEIPQITWEYMNLNDSDIISFWFSAGSLNPITLFEYGAHFKTDKIIVIGCHPDYERKTNVITQTKLARPKMHINENFDDFYNELVKKLLDQIKWQLEAKMMFNL